jgi:hypothetical protein
MTQSAKPFRLFCNILKTAIEKEFVVNLPEEMSEYFDNLQS